MRLYLCVVLALSFFSASALTSEQQTFSDAASWAKQTANQALKPSSLPLNIDDYCKDAACKREIRNPKESRLSDSDINSQKNLAFAKDEAAQAIQNNFNKGKPDIKNDPAMRFALIGQENAFEVTHGISNAYVDCDAGTQCLIKNHTRICTSPTNNNVPCYSTPVAQVEIGVTHYQCQSGWTLKGITCHGFETQCRFDKSNRTVDSAIFNSCFSSGGYTSTFYWNGQRVLPKNGYHKGEYKYSTSTNGCGMATTQLYEICGPVPIEKPATMTCDVGYTLSGAQCIKNTFSWKTDCSLLKDCKKTNQVCIEGPQTRIINGIPTHLDCWKYQVNHLCELSDSCASLPKDCKEQSRSCSLKQNGVCVEEEIKKSCPEKSCRATQMQCGEQSFCLDGDCYVPEPKLNGNFDKSASALAGLAEAVKDIGDPPKIFTGKPMKCDKKLAGFNDCCKDSGWGQSLGAKCSEGEKALGKAKEKGLTLYVGQYCAKKVLGVCTRKKRSYCVYDSKLAKIIQEQGSIGQLGKGLGSAKNPTCAAITPEELGQINFEHIDFSEFYPEMHANTNLPNFDEIKKRLQSAAGE